MEQWLQFARGPLFIMTFLYMILALARLFVIQIFAVPAVLANTRDKEFDKKEVSKWVLEWFVPLKHIMAARPLLSIISFIWHILLIVIPLLLVDHMLLWNRGLGGFIPNEAILALTLPKHAADGLAAAVILLTILIFIMRAAGKGSRTISEPMDYILLLLLLVPFITGIMAAHPSISPISYTTVMLIHVLGAELVFILMPATKLSHAVLFPFARLSTHLFWKLPEGAGDKIAAELYGEEANV